MKAGERPNRHSLAELVLLRKYAAELTVVPDDVSWQNEAKDKRDHSGPEAQPGKQIHGFATFEIRDDTERANDKEQVLRALAHGGLRIGRPGRRRKRKAC